MCKILKPSEREKQDMNANVDDACLPVETESESKEITAMGPETAKNAAIRWPVVYICVYVQTQIVVVVVVGGLCPSSQFYRHKATVVVIVTTAAAATTICFFL
ncbi:hypothetical protein BKA81DRAFT_30612 [Phyllosticta paracitricarpa]